MSNWKITILHVLIMMSLFVHEYELTRGDYYLLCVSSFDHSTYPSIHGYGCSGIYLVRRLPFIRVSFRWEDDLTGQRISLEAADPVDAIIVATFSARVMNVELVNVTGSRFDIP